MATRPTPSSRLWLLPSTAATPSLRVTGTFKVFAAGLIDKSKNKYSSHEVMRMRAAQPDDGEVLDSRTVSDAPPLRPLSNDIEKVKNAVDGLAY